MAGRSPRDTKLFAFSTQSRSASVLNVGMAGFRSVMGDAFIAAAFITAEGTGDPNLLR
jgi:H+/Cl- antiporter ClcA